MFLFTFKRFKLWTWNTWNFEKYLCCLLKCSLDTCVVSYVELHQCDIVSPRSRDNTGIGILSGPHSHPPVRIVAGVIQKSSLTILTPSKADPASTCKKGVTEISRLFWKCSKKAFTSNLSLLKAPRLELSHLRLPFSLIFVTDKDFLFWFYRQASEISVAEFCETYCEIVYSFTCTILLKWQGFCKETHWFRDCERIEGLEPLVAVAPVYTGHFGVAELEVEVPIVISVFLQLIQDGEERSIWVFRIFIQSIFLARKQTTRCYIVAENLLEDI